MRASGERRASQPHTRVLAKQEVELLCLTPRVLMRGLGVSPRHGNRAKVGGQAFTTTHGFVVGECGLSLSHLKAAEAAFEAAHTVEEDEGTGELALTFRPGDALRALGLDSNGSRQWLRRLLLECGSVMGQLPAWSDRPGEAFNWLTRFRTDVPRSVVRENLRNGRSTTTAKELVDWRICVTAEFRLWARTETSLRHAHLAQLHALGNAPAEAVARFALTGACSLRLEEVLERVGIAPQDWHNDSKSAAYQRVRHARALVVRRADQLRAMGIALETGAEGIYRVVSRDKPNGMLFRKGDGVAMDATPPTANPLQTTRLTPYNRWNARPSLGHIAKLFGKTTSPATDS